MTRWKLENEESMLQEQGDDKREKKSNYFWIDEMGVRVAVETSRESDTKAAEK